MNYFLVLSKSVLLIVQKMVQAGFGLWVHSHLITFNLDSWTGAEGLTPDSILLIAWDCISPLGTFFFFFFLSACYCLCK